MLFIFSVGEWFIYRQGLENDMLYSSLVGVFEKLSLTTKRLEKTWHIAQLLRSTPGDELGKTVLLLQGLVFAQSDDSKIGFSTSSVIKAMSIASGMSASKIEDAWRERGDLGIVAQGIIKNKSQATLFSTPLTVEKVFGNISKLTTVEGQGSVDTKVKLVAELLSSATPLEARYIVRTVLDEMRLGAGEGVMRDALVWAYLPAVGGIFNVCAKCKAALPEVEKCLGCQEALVEVTSQTVNVLLVASLAEVKAQPSLEKYAYILLLEDKDGKLSRDVYNYLVAQVQHAYDICNDFGEVAHALKSGGLGKLAEFVLLPGKPVKVMLAIKESTVSEAFEHVGRPAAVEFKLDGFRLQVHRSGSVIKLFTRRLEEVTDQFPDVVEVVKSNVRSDSFILDAEAVGFDPSTGKFLPFQNISQRIKRKYDIHKLAAELPVQVNVFDILSYQGEECIGKPFSDRRALLEKIITLLPQKLVLTTQIVTDSDEQAQKFYQQALSLGEEGVMFKSLSAPYQPGARVGHMVKLKSVMETLDLVIVGGEWGEGKRSSWISSFLVACRDESGNLLEVGRVATGLKEKDEEGLSFNQMTQLLKPIITKQVGRDIVIKPKVVIEVAYEEIQASPTYSSGFALRFPRVIRDRSDERDEKNCSTLEDVKRLYEGQNRASS